MTGSVNAGMSVVAVDNSGQWDLRNFVDTNGDGIRVYVSGGRIRSRQQRQ